MVNVYQYSVGGHPDHHAPESRFDFPKGQCVYHQEWRLVATDLAADYHSNHDGWEDNWPIDLRIYKESECVWRGRVVLEMEPSFYVV